MTILVDISIDTGLAETPSATVNLVEPQEPQDKRSVRRNAIRDLATAKGLVVPDEDVSPPIAKIGDDELLEDVLDTEYEACFDPDRVDVDVDSLVIEP